MSGLYLVALRSMNAALSFSLKHTDLDTIKCNMNPNLRNFKVLKSAFWNQGNALIQLTAV